MESVIRLFTTTAPDFEVLWLGARDLLTFNNPYLNTQIFTGIGYPPISLLFYLPFTDLNYLLAQNSFTVMSFISLFLSIFLIFKLVRISNKYYFLVLILALLSFPTKFSLGMGQNNFLALFLLLFSFYLYKFKKLKLAGLLLGLAISLKTIFIYFLIIFLIKKEWKVIFYSLLTILISVLLIYLIRGNFDLFEFYISNVLPPLFRFENREIYTNQGLSGFVSRIFTDISVRKLVTLITSLGLVLFNAFLIQKSKNINLFFSITTITLLLIDSLAWQHHFVWLLFPIILLFKSSNNIKDKILVLVSCVLISLNIPNTVILSDNVFLGTLILYGLNLKYL